MQEDRSVVTNSTVRKVTVFDSINESAESDNEDGPKVHGKSKMHMLGDSYSDASSNRSEYEMPWNLLMSVESKSLDASRKFGASQSPKD